ncbi:MAG: hypothetical protein JXR83_08580 [Deltaproteobacteria bacterium]|nr:hypothetical protein [Deltaproteobacteria bacterium]
MAKIEDGGHQLRDVKRGFSTKQMIKGAGGGMRGADYLDLEAEFLERRDSSASVNLRASDQELALASSMMKAAAAGQLGAQEAQRLKPSAAPGVTDAVDARQVVNPAAAQAETDKLDEQTRLEDERVKRKLLLRDHEEKAEEDGEEEEEGDEDVEWVGPFADSDVDTVLKGSTTEQIGRLVQDPEVEMRIYGSLRLVDPNDMRQALATPLRVARHLRVIAGRMLQDAGFSRDDVVHYLSGCFVNLGREFGGPALRNYTSSVGVGAVYPLEVVEHLTEIAPWFIPKTTVAPFVLGRKRITMRAGKAITLRCDPSIKITAFALKGGGEPGYQFAPRPEAGEFGLNVLTPGKYTLLLCGVDDYGFERVQELKVTVKDPAQSEAVDGGERSRSAPPPAARRAPPAPEAAPARTPAPAAPAAPASRPLPRSVPRPGPAPARPGAPIAPRPTGASRTPSAPSRPVPRPGAGGVPRPAGGVPRPSTMPGGRLPPGYRKPGDR